MVGARAWIWPATVLTCCTPALVCPIRMTDPTLWLRSTAACAGVIPEVLTADMNSCPTRCAGVIAAMTRSTQPVVAGGGGVRTGGPGTEEEAAPVRVGAVPVREVAD